MDKRYIKFFALALPIYLMSMFWIQRNQNERKEAAAAYQSAVDAANFAATSGTLTLARPAPGQPTPGQTELVPGIAQDRLPSAPISPPARRDVDVEPVWIDTPSYHIGISPAGAVPVVWELLLRNGDSDDDGDSEPGNEMDSNHLVPMLDDQLDAALQQRPLELVLRELYSRYYNEFNTDLYEFEKIERDRNFITFRFTSATTANGLTLIKTYEFPREPDNYESHLTLTLVNSGESRLTFNNESLGLGLTLGPGLGPAPETAQGFGAARYDFTEAVFKLPEEIESLKVSDPGESKAFTQSSQWAALHNRYFMIAALPDPDSATGSEFSAGIALIDQSLAMSGLTDKQGLSHYPRLELYSAPFTIEPGGRAEFGYTLFAGPKERKILEATEQGLERILFYNSWAWMRGLCMILMSMLIWFHGLVHSWGIAIILLVVTLRILTFPLTQIGLRHQTQMMAQQAKIKPQLDKINEKHKDNPTKRNKAMMELYKENNVNPLGMFKGCIWMFLQLPIFFALYRLLSQSFDLRGASFLWIADLSQPDHLFGLPFSIPLLGSSFNLLPFLTSATQFVSAKLSMNPKAASDPTQAAMQKQMMYMMPIMIFVMTYSFPSGLVLYWFVSNLWQIFQQQVVNRKIFPPKDAAQEEAAPAAT